MLKPGGKHPECGPWEGGRGGGVLFWSYHGPKACLDTDARCIPFPTVNTRHIMCSRRDLRYVYIAIITRSDLKVI